MLIQFQASIVDTETAAFSGGASMEKSAATECLLHSRFSRIKRGREAFKRVQLLVCETVERDLGA
jgi:hypothetical protein